MGKPIRAALLAMAAVLVSGVVSVLPVAPAHAAEGYDRCPEGYYCMFSGLDGTGDMITIQSDTPDLGALGMDDRAKSDWNRTDATIWLHSEVEYGGCNAVTSVGGKGNFYPAYQDFFSSVRVGGTGGPSC